MDPISQIDRQLRSIVEAYTPSQRAIHLFVSYYPCGNPQRNQELELCLRLNTQNQLFTKIFIINEADPVPSFVPQSDRIMVLNKQRLTFSGFFAIANRYTDEETINILINSDIVIGENFDHLVFGLRQAMCLSRYEIDGEGRTRVVVGGGSHDCWIWRGEISETMGRFYMGKFLCDGVLAHEFYINGYMLKNAMRDLKVYHVHLTNYRTYSTVDRVGGYRKGIRFSSNNGVFALDDVYYDGWNKVL